MAQLRSGPLCRGPHDSRSWPCCIFCRRLQPRRSIRVFCIHKLDGIAHRTQICTCAMANTKASATCVIRCFGPEDVFRDGMRPLHARDQTQRRNLQVVMHAKSGLAKSASALYAAGVRGALASARPSARPLAAVQSRAQCPSAPQAKHTFRRLPPGPASPRAWSLH